MRAISADLQAVQRVRSPRARVTVTVASRGQNPEAPALAWSELVANTGQTSFKLTAAVGRSDGSILKWVVNNPTGIQQYPIADPTAAASWASATPTTIVAGTCGGVAALRVPGAATIRLFYIAAGNVHVRESTDDGASWGGATTVYAGGDVAGDLVLAYIANGVTLNGPWFVGFSTFNGGTGDYAARFGYYAGSAWVTHAYGEVGWRAAGIYPNWANAAHLVAVFRQAERGAARLRTLVKNGSAYSGAADVDQTQAGRFGLALAYYRFCHLPELGCLLGIAGESAWGAGAYLGVGGLFRTTAPGADEPIMLPGVACSDGEAHACVCAAGASVYLVGDTVVYRGVPQPATAATLEPIRYLYDDHQVELDFAAGIPELRVGQVLTVTRTLSWGAQSGAESFAACIVRVARGTDAVKVVAADALGYLGVARCRRPAILNDGSAPGLAAVMRSLCARFGLALTVDNTALESAAALPMTLQPAESLRGAAYRITSQANAWLVPANDGSFGLTLIAPPSSSSGDYSDTPHDYGVAPSEQPVFVAREVADYRRLAFAYVLGAYSADPEDGAAVGMAQGPALPNTRPLSYSLTNQRYNSAARVAAAAAAEAARQRKLAVDAEFEAGANLALEVHDLVRVTLPELGWSARLLRVRRIAETYDRGRLTQRLYLGLDYP